MYFHLRLIIAICLSAFFAFAQNFENTFYKIDTKYQTGRYHQAKDLNDGLIETIQKSKNKNFKDEARANFYAAKV